MQVWADPLNSTTKTLSKISASSWENFATTAWQFKPSLAINLIDRYSDYKSWHITENSQLEDQSKRSLFFFVNDLPFLSMQINELQLAMFLIYLAAMICNA